MELIFTPVTGDSIALDNKDDLDDLLDAIAPVNLNFVVANATAFLNKLFRTIVFVGLGGLGFGAALAFGGVAFALDFIVDLTNCSGVSSIIMVKSDGLNANVS